MRKAIAKHGMTAYDLLLNDNVITRVLLVRHFILVAIRFMLFHSSRNRPEDPLDLRQSQKLIRVALKGHTSSPLPSYGVRTATMTTSSPAMIVVICQVKSRLNL